MSSFQLLSCLISIGGDDKTIVSRDATDPIPFCELLVLKHLHGRDSVRDIRVVGEDERDPMDERHRLTSIYGAAVAAALGGEHVPLPTEDPGLAQRAAKAAAEAAKRAAEDAKLADAALAKAKARKTAGPDAVA